MEISLEQYNKMAERLTELEYLLAERQWIPVSERLPEESGWYLVSVKTGNVTTAYYRVAEADKGGCYWRDGVKKPTAWMPLPEPYEEVVE